MQSLNQINYNLFEFNAATKTFTGSLSELKKQNITYENLRLPGDVFGFEVKGLTKNILFTFKNKTNDSWLFESIDGSSFYAVIKP